MSTEVTTDFVRRHYAKGPTAYFEDGTVAKWPTAADVEFAGAQFDRWLAAHDAEVKAQALEEHRSTIERWYESQPGLVPKRIVFADLTAEAAQHREGNTP